MITFLAVLVYVASIVVSWWAFSVNVKRNNPNIYDKKLWIVGAMATGSIVLFLIGTGSIWLTILYLFLTGFGCVAVAGLVAYIYMKNRPIHLG